jgi:hypothetical protein
LCWLASSHIRRCRAVDPLGLGLNQMGTKRRHLQHWLQERLFGMCKIYLRFETARASRHGEFVSLGLWQCMGLNLDRMQGWCMPLARQFGGAWVPAAGCPATIARRSPPSKTRLPKSMRRHGSATKKRGRRGGGGREDEMGDGAGPSLQKRRPKSRWMGEETAGWEGLLHAHMRLAVGSGTRPTPAMIGQQRAHAPRSFETASERA